jgi:hypothetical protein
VPPLPFYWQQRHVDDLGARLVASTREKIDLNRDFRQEATLALQSSSRAIRASRERITKTDVLLARLWGRKEP